jgi:hypothetical protein
MTVFALTRTALVVLLMTAAGSPALRADDSGEYFLSLYSGKAAKDRLLEIVTEFNTGFLDSYLAAAALGWVHWDGEKWRGEVEGQVVRHWGEQSHWEFNLAYVARWKPFPWDEHVDTSIALGGGVSYATEVPFIEPRAKELGVGESERLLGYLLLEVELAPPGDSPWSGFVRLHHRSGAKGLFSDVNGGSNFITLGARYHFD